MKTKRRDFLKTAGLAGLGILTGGRRGFASKDANLNTYEFSHKQKFNMSGYVAPKIDPVRIGIIGMGGRGSSHLRTWIRIEGVEVRALADIVPENAESAKETLDGTDHNPELYTGSKNAWKKLCERDDIDLVIITTPWYMHARMGIYAMENGKHVASEVPAAGTIEECAQLVETSERTRKYFRMMENYAFRPFQLLTLNMARQGFFGDVVHADCAYNTSKMHSFGKTRYWNMWWLKQYAWRKGNIYPTHGLGPVATIMDINRGDRFDYLVSLESEDFIMNSKAKELAEEDDFYKPFTGKDYRGTMSVTMIKTKKGRSIVLQHDASTPSPHDLKHGIYGTDGAARMDPPPRRLCVGNHKWINHKETYKAPAEWITEEEHQYEELKEKYTPEIMKRMGEVTRGSGHGGSDLMQAWRIVDCLRNGIPMDQDVYDAASWSSIVALSEWSVRNRSNSIDIPDFTDGSWKTNKRNMDINLEKSGDTKVLS